jgi:hypothetical protein
LFLVLDSYREIQLLFCATTFDEIILVFGEFDCCFVKFEKKLVWQGSIISSYEHKHLLQSQQFSVIRCHVIFQKSFIAEFAIKIKLQREIAQEWSEDISETARRNILAVDSYEEFFQYFKSLSV